MQHSAALPGGIATAIMDGYRQQFSDLREQLGDLRQDAQNMNHDAKGMLENLWEAFCQVNISAKASAEVRFRTAVRASTVEHDTAIRSLKQEHKSALQAVRRGCGALQSSHRTSKQDIREALTLFQTDFAAVCASLNNAVHRCCVDASDAAKAREEIAGRYVQLRSQVQQMEDEHSDANNDLLRKLHEAEAATVALQEQNAKFTSELSTVSSSLSILQESAQKERAAYARDLSDARAAMASLTQEVGTLRQEAKGAGDKYEACSSELGQLKLALSSAQQERQSLQERLVLCEGQARTGQAQVKAWKEQCKALEELLVHVGIEMPRLMDDERAGIKRSLLCMRGRPSSAEPPTPGSLPLPPPPPVPMLGSGEEERGKKRARQEQKEQLQVILAESRAQLEAAIAASRVQGREACAAPASVSTLPAPTPTPVVPMAPALLAWRKAKQAAVPVIRAALA